MTVVLITGGARSGKSRQAESMTLSMAEASGGTPICIATAQALDDEMKLRIAAHRTQRGHMWRTIEEPIALSDALYQTDGQGPRLVDCLTLWLSNMMLAELDWREEAARLCDMLEKQTDPVLLVTNEVGLGIVPDNTLARRYRDAAGTLNQMVAGCATSVLFMVAGLPMKVR